jgi:hypothetical protein
VRQRQQERNRFDFALLVKRALLHKRYQRVGPLVARVKYVRLVPNRLSGNSFRRPYPVRRAHVRELREQVFVGTDLIIRYLSV